MGGGQNLIYVKRASLCVPCKKVQKYCALSHSGHSNFKQKIQAPADVLFIFFTVSPRCIANINM